jgi:hypothetical protein
MVKNVIKAASIMAPRYGATSLTIDRRGSEHGRGWVAMEDGSRVMVSGIPSTSRLCGHPRQLAQNILKAARAAHRMGEGVIRYGGGK